ncbi:MAG: urease accessory UreF family protein [Verrucomicrobiota bacterium]
MNGPVATTRRRRAVRALDPRPSTLDWLLWQLADSALPTGGFAHSAGLEAAWQQGAIPDTAALESFLDASLAQLGHAGLPLMTAAYDVPAELPEWDALCDAFTTNHVANRASRAQGQALLRAARQIFGGDPAPVLPFGHFYPVFGSELRRLEIPRDTAMRLLFFNHLRGLLAAAVRLNIVGPLQAQSLQHQFAPRAESALQRCSHLTVSDLAQVSPLLDLWQGAQDRLYSRLFQS